MTNPFDLSAQQPPPRPNTPGTLDVAQALGDGWEGMKRNFWPMFGGSIAAGALSGFSLLLCIIPFFVVGPALAYGTFRAQLDAQDGRTEFATYFRGFDKLSETAVPFLIYFLIIAVVQIPPNIAGFILGLFDPGDSAIVTLLIQGASWTLTLVYGAVVSTRLSLAPFLIVDRNVAPVDALAHSWEVTRPVWGQIIALGFASSLIPLAGLLCCIVGVFPAALVVGIAQASAYRQIMGRA
jgi:hypothetical protein